MRAGPSLARRLLVRYTIAVVAVLAGLAFALDRTLASAFLDDLTSSLADQADAVRLALPDDAALQPAVVELGQRLDVRITVIAGDGEVLADSARDHTTMENHASRPEVHAALDGRTGVASRTSETTGEPYRYVARALADGLVVRVALPLDVVAERLGRVRRLVAVASALALAAGVAAVWFLARGLTRPLRSMTSSVERMSRGELATRVPAAGTSELTLLAETLNRMSAELEARIEQLARDRHERDAILSAMEEGVVLVDRGGDVAYVNPAAARILGRTPATIRDLAPSGLRTVADEARTEETPREVEIEVGVPIRTLHVSAVPLETLGDVLLVIRDVTIARRLAAIRRDFVADASHELKTPVASISAAAETMERAAVDDPAAASRFARRLRLDATRLSRIVSDLLDLSRLESEQRPAPEPVRLDRVVGEELDRLRPQAIESGVVLDWQAAPVTVMGTAKDLQLLARNLLENAVRYTPSGGRVSVEVARDDGHATLRVEDTGIGIPSRDLPRIFERFYRVDRARSRETGGTGLGLSIARHVVDRYGGQIEAESELGQGSTFRVVLPAGS